MNVLLVTGIFPPDIGGPATFVPRLASFLAECGDTVTVMTLADEPPAQHRLPYKVIAIRRGTPLAFRVALTVVTVCRLAFRADVVLANGLFPEVGLACFISRRPVVCKVVGDPAWERSVSRGWTRLTFEDFQSGADSWPARLQSSVRDRIMRRVDAVIVPSEFLQTIVRGWGVRPERTTVIYNGVPLGAVTAELDAIGDVFTLVTASRLVPWKRVDGIIDALAEMNDPRVRLVVVGDGPERENLEKHAEQVGVGDRVDFKGRKSPEATQAIMASGDIFVLNSTYEGLPHVVLEAMSHGLPVIATDGGGTREVIERGGGLLVGTGRDDFVEALAQLRDDEALRRQLGGA